MFNKTLEKFMIWVGKFKYDTCKKVSYSPDFFQHRFFILKQRRIVEKMLSSVLKLWIALVIMLKNNGLDKIVLKELFSYD